MGSYVLIVKLDPKTPVPSVVGPFDNIDDAVEEGKYFKLNQCEVQLAQISPPRSHKKHAI